MRLPDDVGLELEDGDVVLEGGCLVVLVHYDALHLPLVRGHVLGLPRNVVLSQLDRQRREEARLAMGGREHVPVGDEHAAALVLREQPEERRLLDQNLPRPIAKLGLFTADNSTFSDRANTTV